MQVEEREYTSKRETKAILWTIINFFKEQNRELTNQYTIGNERTIGKVMTK